MLRTHKLSLNRSKCFFGRESVAYLGHIILVAGVAMDPSKVEAIEAWPPPHSLWVLRGFLGLTDYYCKFIASYNMIVAPLMTLLKRGYSGGIITPRRHSNFSSKPLCQHLSFRCRTSTSGSSSTVMHQAQVLVPCYTKGTTLSPTLASDGAPSSEATYL